jgi:hypothetical protein
MTPDDLVERVARKIAAHVGAEKFWGLYKDTAQDIVDIALEEAAEVERLKALTEWRPFDTAPKDRTEIIVWRKDAGTFTAIFCEPISDEPVDEEDWCWFSAGGDDLTGDLPTLWMPMPAPPLTQEKTDV